MPRALRYPVLALAASVGWFAGFLVSFTPAQAILANPARQSEKFLAVFFSIPPTPRIDRPQEFAGLILVLGAFLALGCWLLMVPWFELYLPWNVLHEPMDLVLLEAFCWWVTLSLSGLTMALADRGAVA